VKKIFVLLVLIGVIFVVVERERLFVRDPLGSVLRDGVKEDGAQVYINYSNDVMIENDNPPLYVTIVQKGQKVGAPAKVSCVHWIVCMTDADVATQMSTDPGSLVESMTNRAVLFRSGSGRQTVVKLR
jgi:hypothetical protein